MVHVLADGPHLLQGGFHVELGSGQQVAQGAALGEGVTAQIDSGDHGPILSDRIGRPVAPYHWLIQAHGPAVPRCVTD